MCVIIILFETTPNQIKSKIWIRYKHLAPLASTSCGNRASENLARFSYNLVISRHLTSHFHFTVTSRISFSSLSLWWRVWHLGQIIQCECRSQIKYMRCLIIAFISFIGRYLSFTERMQYHLYSATKSTWNRCLTWHTHTHTHIRISFVIIH